MSNLGEEEEGGRASRASGVSSSASSTVRRSDHHGRSKKHSKKPPTVSFRFAFGAKEDHGKEIYGCAFNPYGGMDHQRFATVGKDRVTVYECTDDGKFKMLHAFKDPDDDSLYTCTWLYNAPASSYILATGGLNGIIKLIPFCGTASTNSLIGHGQAINDLMTHPMDSQLLLSASKDHELRLWNIRAGVCVAIFGGEGGHKSEVLSCDWDLLGNSFVSAGMDHAIKIWSIDDNDSVKEAVRLSKHYYREQEETNFPTVKLTTPEFSTMDVHRDYVDCVKWYGYTLFSKSCENAVCHWKPGSSKELGFSKGNTNVTLFSKMSLPNCQCWFMKFAMDSKFKLLAAGNQSGKIFVWELNSIPCQPIILERKTCTALVRQVAFSPDGQTIIAVCDDSSIWRWIRK